MTLCAVNDTLELAAQEFVAMYGWRYAGTMPTCPH